jgi:hypothetical protein
LYFIGFEPYFLNPKTPNLGPGRIDPAVPIVLESLLSHNNAVRQSASVAIQQMITPDNVNMITSFLLKNLTGEIDGCG